MSAVESPRRAGSPDDIRFRIAASRRILFRAGLDSQIGGHVSVRAPGEEAFYVSPSQYFDETMPDHVLKVGFDLTVLEPGPLPGALGINFHADIYRARPDVNCVIHTHARNAAIISTLGTSPVPYHSYAALFQDDVALFRDDPHATPDVEGPEIAKAMGGKRALLIANHGVVHVGATLEETTAETLMLEIAAGYQIEAMAIGGTPFDRDTAGTYRDLFLRITFRKELWDANFRRLRKSDPDLFA